MPHLISTGHNIVSRVWTIQGWLIVEYSLCLIKTVVEEEMITSYFTFIIRKQTAIRLNNNHGNTEPFKEDYSQLCVTKNLVTYLNSISSWYESPSWLLSLFVHFLKSIDNS